MDNLKGIQTGSTCIFVYPRLWNGVKTEWNHDALGYRSGSTFNLPQVYTTLKCENRKKNCRMLYIILRLIV